MKNIRINLVVFLLSVCVFGQSKMTFEDLKFYYDNSNKKNEKSKYAQKYLNEAIAQKSKIYIAKGYYWLALLEYDVNNKKALQLLDSVIKYSKNNLEDKYFPAAAYCDKAIFLEKQYNFKEAIVNYNLAEKYAIRNNLDYYYVIRENIAYTKSESLGEVEDALVLYKECFNYFKTKEVRNKKYSKDYQYAIFGLADVYKTLNKTDSCSYYNKLGYKEASITNNDNFKYMFVLNEGANQILKRNYKVAIDSIDKALPKLKNLKNIDNVFASYFYYGKAHEGLGNKQKALINYKKVDSIYQLNKRIITPEFTDGYLFLIKYFKVNNDKNNQLKYLTTYLTIDSALQKNYKELNKQLQKGYDVPHLIKDKDDLIQSLSNYNQLFYIGVFCLISIILGLVIYQRRLKKKYSIRFEKILSETNSTHTNEVPYELQETEPIATDESQLINSSKEISINDEIVSLLLKKLDDFENKKEYLNSTVSVISLSENFETNTKYLSKVINVYKNKTFVNYINDLRIDYAVVDLQKNKTSRKYTLQALSNQYGFNNAESFSKAFHKKTGLKPSFFIKELENKST